MQAMAMRVPMATSQPNRVMISVYLRCFKFFLYLLNTVDQYLVPLHGSGHTYSFSVRDLRLLLKLRQRAGNIAGNWRAPALVAEDELLRAHRPLRTPGILDVGNRGTLPRLMY